MKKLILLTFGFLSLYSSFSLGQPVWTSQSSGTSDTLFAVKFTDTLTGITVGGSGTIRKTTNGGINWFALTSGTTNHLNSVFAIDQNIVYACGNSGTIIKSTNGGINWIFQAGGYREQLSLHTFH